MENRKRKGSGRDWTQDLRSSHMIWPAYFPTRLSKRYYLWLWHIYMTLDILILYKYYTPISVHIWTDLGLFWADNYGKNTVKKALKNWFERALTEAWMTGRRWWIISFLGNFCYIISGCGPIFLCLTPLQRASKMDQNEYKIMPGNSVYSSDLFPFLVILLISFQLVVRFPRD